MVQMKVAYEKHVHAVELNRICKRQRRPPTLSWMNATIQLKLKTNVDVISTDPKMLGATNGRQPKLMFFHATKQQCNIEFQIDVNLDQYD